MIGSHFIIPESLVGSPVDDNKDTLFMEDGDKMPEIIHVARFGIHIVIIHG
jgi:hypothetical protein